MRPKDFDPLAYIENAFLDNQKPDTLDASRLEKEGDGLKVSIPTLTDFLKTGPSNSSAGEEQPTLQLVATPMAKAVVQDDGKSTKFKRTTMSAPRPRRSKNGQDTPQRIDPELQEIWELLPKNIDFLCAFYDDSVTKNYYRGEFKETRQDLVKRLLDPELSLEETSRLLGVCPATVRRYTNREWLKHHRTVGGQRRFRLSDVVRFVHEHGRFPEES